MKGIYQYIEDWGRMGTLSGMFLADSEEVEAAIGKTYYFGEVLGKHSDVSGVISKDTLKLISAEPGDVAYFERLDISIGYNPLAHTIDGFSDEQD